jgi:hypothetical protein
MSWDSSVGIATSYGLDDQEFDSRQGQDIFPLSTVSTLALGPNQPPIKWVLGALSLGVKRQGHEGAHSPPSHTEIVNGGAIPPVPHTSSWRAA